MTLNIIGIIGIAALAIMGMIVEKRDKQKRKENYNQIKEKRYEHDMEI